MVREHAYTNSGARIALIDKVIIFAVWRLRVRAFSTSSQIREPQLDALLALPAINNDLTGGVQGPPAIFQKRLPKRLANGTEGNRVHEFSVV